MTYFRQSGLEFLNNYIAFVDRFRIAIIFSFIVVSVFAATYTINNLGMNTSTKDMLSPDLEWRKLDLEYEKHFPQFIDDILIVIEADTPDQAADTAGIMYARLQQETSLFNSIYYPKALSLFREDALLFLTEDELYELSDNLAKIQPFLTRLTDDMSLRGLFNMLSDAIDAINDGEDIDINPLISELTTAIQANLKSESMRVSWQNLIDDQVSNPSKLNQEYIILQPVLDFNELLPATLPIAKIREISNIPQVIEIGSRVSLTGNAVLSHEELLSVSRGTEIAIILSICIVTLIMVYWAEIHFDWSPIL